MIGTPYPIELPIQPEGFEWLFKHSNLIAYVEIIEAEEEIWEYVPPLMPGVYPAYRKQQCKAKILRVLKGSKKLEGKVIDIIKRKSRYRVYKKEKTVLYLERKKRNLYQTIDAWGGENRLHFLLAKVKSLQWWYKGSGIVVGVTGIKNKEEYQDLKIYIFEGRHKYPLNLKDSETQASLLKIENLGKYNVTEVSLKPEKIYTILLKAGNSYTFYKYKDEEYYPTVFLEKNEWEALEFDLESPFFDLII